MYVTQVYWGMESHNATDVATVAQLKSARVEPGSELLYCGDRLDPAVAPQSFLQANCDTIATFRHGAAPGDNLHVDQAECPMDSPNAEPECIDSALDGYGGGAGSSSAFLVFFVLLLGVLTWCSARQAAGTTRSDHTAALRAPGDVRSRSAGLSAEDIAALPRMSVMDGRSSTCTVCFEPVDDGEEIFALRCGHRHHQQCLTDWLQRKSECPDCRSPITLDDALSHSPPPRDTGCENSGPPTDRPPTEQQPTMRLSLAATGRWSTSRAAETELPRHAVENPVSASGGDNV